jgi:predicted helicase
LIAKEALPYKFKNEIHANEIVLLAYYIACINVEAVYQDIVKENQYQPFDGMVLTDTFQLYEQDKDMIATLLPENSSKRNRQKNQKITVIVANPPYSVQNQISYPRLDKKMKELVVDPSSARHKSGLYDTFFRALIWSSLKIDQTNGVVALVINNSWITSSIADEVRSFLAKTFSKIYIFDLKGDVRKTQFEKGLFDEGENIFGQKTQTGIALVVLVKGKVSKRGIFYATIGSGLSTHRKLGEISQIGSFNNLFAKYRYTKIAPNDQNDWINPRIKLPDDMHRLGSKSNEATSIFGEYTSGVKTNRDEWCINFSKRSLGENLKSTIDHYNSILDRPSRLSTSKRQKKKIKWDTTLETSLSRGQRARFEIQQIR